MTSDALAIEADVRRLADVRAFIRERSSSNGLGSEAVSDLVQAVDEVVTNIVEHGYRGAPGRVEVEVDVDAGVDAEPGRIEVRIRDGCPPFDPDEVPEPDLDMPLERRPLGGMGVHLARALTDEMRHRILPEGGNELILVKVIQSTS
ncbi:MAG: ATP-binding protein [Chloroflexota bacterium]|jgi:serine/threonine-protein kinase RsbW